MKSHINLSALMLGIGLSVVLSDTVFAQATGDVGQVENFIRSVIQAIAGLAGLVATGFFVVGGFTYITSSGNPENLERAKRTLMYSATGLVITVGAFVLSGIVTGLAGEAFGS